jgi:RNA polymerase sigma-70 factor, ECF subfamily
LNIHREENGVVHPECPREGEAAQSVKTDFAELLRQNQTRLFGYIHSLVRDLNDADDLFHQTTMILWRKFNEFDRRRSFCAWACGIARLETASFLRSRGRQRLYFSDDLTLLLIEAHEEMTDEESQDRREALARCAEKLRDRDRELLAECYDQCAAALRKSLRSGYGCTVSWCAGSLRRGFSQASSVRSGCPSPPRPHARS